MLSDFLFLTLRNLTAIERDGSIVKDDYILSISTGKQKWTNNIKVDSIIGKTGIFDTINSNIFDGRWFNNYWRKWANWYNRIYRSNMIYWIYW